MKNEKHFLFDKVSSKDQIYFTENNNIVKTNL